MLYASSGGSTKAVAEFIAARLRAQGWRPTSAAWTKWTVPRATNSVVLGSAVHDRALLPAAEHFLLRNDDALRVLPVWLFCLGIGPSLRGPVGRTYAMSSRRGSPSCAS